MNVNSENLTRSKVEYDYQMLILFVVMLLSQFYFDNSIYLIIALGTSFYIISKIFVPYKSGIFTVHFLYHMMQIVSGILFCNYLSIELKSRSENLGIATLLSYAGMFFLYVPIIYFQKKIPNQNLSSIRRYSDEISTRKVLEIYIIAFIITNFLAVIAFQISGLTQIIVSCKNIKWFLFILLGFQVVLKKEFVLTFVSIIFIEFILGFLSFFSDFKTVLFYLVIVLIFFITRIKLRHFLIFFILLVSAFVFGVKWTAVKGEYRKFLNKGDKTQTVKVDQNEAIYKLMELSENETDFDKYAAQFFDRIQYTYHLAKTMERVPDVLPYENGSNIASIFNYVFTPRYFNPDKQVNETSKKATKYTGIAYLGIESGVSFSLGYFADCYIDFGYFGMMIPIFLLGLIYGFTYYYFSTKTTNNYLINVAFVSAIFMELIAFESDGTFLLGRLVSNLVTFILFKIFMMPLVYGYIKKREILNIQ